MRYFSSEYLLPRIRNRCLWHPSGSFLSQSNSRVPRFHRRKSASLLSRNSELLREVRHNCCFSQLLFNYINSRKTTFRSNMGLPSSRHSRHLERFWRLTTFTLITTSRKRSECQLMLLLMALELLFIQKTLI